MKPFNFLPWVSKTLGFFHSFYTRYLLVLTAPLLANAAKGTWEIVNEDFSLFPSFGGL